MIMGSRKTSGNPKQCAISARYMRSLATKNSSRPGQKNEHSLLLYKTALHSELFNASVDVLLIQFNKYINKLLSEIFLLGTN